MAKYTLTQLSTSGRNRTLSSAVPAVQNSAAAVSRQPEIEDTKNNGGFFGGLGYFGEKVGLGFLSGLEGIWDYSAGGIAKLFGADDWAERQFENDWVNYAHADEWYDPGQGWKIAGDVAGGVGTSLPALAGVAAGAAITYFSGGTAAPVAAKIIAASIAPTMAGLGAAGNATKEAYMESGNLGGKEFGYGALVGVTEAGVELVTQGIGTGSGRIAKSLLDGAAGKTAKEFTETIVKMGGKSVLKNIGQDFASEAIEEGISEFLAPQYKKITYDPDAKNATAQEIAYASFIGGLSGTLMSLGNSAVNTTANFISGSKAVDSGSAEKILKNAMQIAATESVNDTGYESFRQVKEIYESLSESMKNTNGAVTTAKQKMQLGQLKKATTVSTFMPFIERGAIDLLYHADTVAEKYNTFGMTDASGKAVSFTADQIRSGVDADLIERSRTGNLTKEENRTLTMQIRSALTSNSTLSTLAIASATGNIMMNTRRFAEAALAGSQLADTADLNAFLERAGKEEISAVSDALGISDWTTLTIDDFRSRVAAIAESGQLSEFAKQAKRIRNAAQTAKESAQKLPVVLDESLSDGVYRFSDAGLDMAVIKEGEELHIYDYESGNISRTLTSDELGGILRQFRDAQSASAANAERFSTETELGLQSMEIDTMAAEKIPEYHTLSEPNRQAVRMTIRQAQAHGMAESDVTTFARVAARSGLNIVFDGKRSAVGDASISGSTVYIDPKASKERIRTRLLLHEVGHALLRTKEGQNNLMLEAFRHIAPERSKRIYERYAALYKSQGMSREQYLPIINEEIAAAYIEDVLGDSEAWEYILDKEPSLSDKVLGFFSKAAKDYASDEGLSAEARRLLRSYKKLFDRFAKQNQGNNASDLTLQDEGAKKSVTRTDEKNVQVTDEDGMRLSIKKDMKGELYVEVDSPAGVSEADSPKEIVETLKTIVRTKFKDFVKANGQSIGINNRAAGEWVKSKNAKFLLRSDQQGFLDKQNAFGNADELLQASKDYIGEEPKHSRKDNFVEFARGVVSFSVDGRGYEADIIVGTTKSGVALLYDLVDIRSKKIATDISETAQDRGRNIPVANNSITDSGENVNRKDVTSSETVKNSSDQRFALRDDNVKELFGEEVANSIAKGETIGVDTSVSKGAPKGLDQADGKKHLKIDKKVRERLYSKNYTLRVFQKFTKISELADAPKTEITSALGEILKSVPDMDHRREAAHNIAEFISSKVMIDLTAEDSELRTAMETISHLRIGIGSLTFSDSELAEIQEKTGKGGLRSFRSRWGYKKPGRYTSPKTRTPMSVFVEDIAKGMRGMERLRDMNPVDAFIEIDSIYRKAKAQMDEKKIESARVLKPFEVESLVGNIEKTIMDAYASTDVQIEKSGKQNSDKVELLLGKIEKEIMSVYENHLESNLVQAMDGQEKWKSEHNTLKGRNGLLGQCMSLAQRMKDLRVGTYANATQADMEIFKGSLEELSKIQFRGNLSVTAARKTLEKLQQWYTPTNPVLEYKSESEPGRYVEGVAEMLGSLCEGAKNGFSNNDLKTLRDVMSYFVNFVENYGKVFRRGEWIDAQEMAKRYIRQLDVCKSLGIGARNHSIRQLYRQTFSEPGSLARYMDGYENGWYTDNHSDIRDAIVDAQIAEMEIFAPYEEFLQKHKKYLKKAADTPILYRGKEISHMQLIGLALTSKRKHAWAGLVYNGFSYTDKNGNQVRVGGTVDADVQLTEAALEKEVKKIQREIGALLTDIDKKYIAILEKVYNVETRRLKADRDMQRFGFTNATDDYYYPIRRGFIAKSIDTDEEFQRVRNASFNKDTVKGAKQELFIESADTLFRRHVSAVVQYAYLSPVIESYDMLFNLDVGGNPNHPISIATESANVWSDGNAYFKDLLADAQGISSSKIGDSVMSFVRSGFAKYQLAANPKVWITQMSSIFASSSLLDMDCIARGMTLSAKGLDEYCPLAKLRQHENTAALAQAVLDRKAKRGFGKIGKIGDALMVPIGKMDRYVVGRLFGACQAQVEKNGDAKIGTDANRVEAGKLLRQVILETQQNAFATDRSAAMRRGNEFVRTATMFSSDAMKVLGRVIDGAGEVSVLKKKIKRESDPHNKSVLEVRLKMARKKERKAIAALVLSSIFMASVSQLFRFLYAKEQKDESIAETMITDTIGNLFGGLPLIKDLYSLIVDGYGIENNETTAINELANSVLKLTDVFSITEESSAQDKNRALRNLSYSVGQILGIPTRNLYNVFYGLTKRFSPETAYAIDSAFYAKNYKNDLQKAIEKGDDGMVSHIMGLLLGERMDENIDEKVFDELLVLSKNGCKVLPRTAPDSVTIGGEEFELSASEQSAFTEIMATAQISMKRLFAKTKYKSLSGEQKTEAINYIYDLYYEKAMRDALGVNRGGDTLTVADIVGADQLALLYIRTKGLESDKDAEGKTVNGSLRKKTVAAINALGISTEKKLLLICAKGYSLKDGDVKGISAQTAKKVLLRYILSLSGKTRAEKAALAEICGFEVKNGKISLANL